MERNKLDLIIQAIAEARELTPRGHEVRVYISADNGLDTVYPQVIKDALLKLQNDERIISIKSFPDRLLPPVTSDRDARHKMLDNLLERQLYPWRLHFTIDVLEDFDRWYADYCARRKGLPETLPPLQEERVGPEPEVVYRITYTPAREVLLNDVFQLAKPDFDSENDLVFDYLYEHPNEKFAKQQIEAKINLTIAKPLHKIVENLGFKGDLKKLFFNVSKNSILFRNPITRRDLEQLGISRIKLH